MASRRQTKSHTENSTKLGSPQIGTVRIVGGDFRGRTLTFPADPRIRPMKDRLREALFNLLGPSIRGTHAIDLFAGTGALGFEALSRGANHATFIERHVPTAKLLRENVRILEVEDKAEVVASDTFVWGKRQSQFGPEPVVAFCSPPYEFYSSRLEDLQHLLAALLERIPAGSKLVVEFDDSFTHQQLPHPELWNVRSYSSIHLAILQR